MTPTKIVSIKIAGLGFVYSPSSPDSVYAHTLGDIYDELNVGVVVVVSSTGYL